jgi:hypothetical protein
MAYLSIFVGCCLGIASALVFAFHYLLATSWFASGYHENTPWRIRLASATTFFLAALFVLLQFAVAVDPQFRSEVVPSAIGWVIGVFGSLAHLSARYVLCTDGEQG